MKIAVVVRTRDAGRAAEALRAALGLTLRDASVAVVLEAPLPDDEQVARALGTLRALGHDVAATAEAVVHADAVEVWT
jgi:hypothetical protein